MSTSDLSAAMPGRHQIGMVAGFRLECWPTSRRNSGRLPVGISGRLRRNTHHDKRLAEATPYPLPAGSRLLQDLGFLAFTLPQVEILMPTRKPPGAELPLAQKRATQALHSRRLRIEHVNSSVKRCRVVKARIRLWKQGVRDVVMEICCALHNFRVRLTPWQPMV